MSKEKLLPSDNTSVISLGAFTDFEADEDRRFSAILYSASSDEAPSTCKDLTALKVYKMEADVSEVPSDMRTRQGRVYYRADHELKIQVDNTKLRFFVTMGRKEVSTVVAKYGV
ncbi:MAG: hypothetical protein M1814_002753 [Vezdaea aestivalis]|nr:MAG: hypothetical protein M1814_002753 [Vezdaea aestivalis]